jgi:hypothetical protein
MGKKGSFNPATPFQWRKSFDPSLSSASIPGKSIETGFDTAPTGKQRIENKK